MSPKTKNRRSVRERGRKDKAHCYTFGCSWRDSGEHARAHAGRHVQETGHEVVVFRSFMLVRVQTPDATFGGED